MVSRYDQNMTGITGEHRAITKLAAHGQEA